MYGSSFDFTDISLPGVGGGINAGNAVTTDQLARMNKSGKKWSPDASGGMSHHNETQLAGNAESRGRRANLVNREYNENADGGMAMKEIFDRKKARAKEHMGLKEKEYAFADAAPGNSQDNEMMAIPQPFAEGHPKGCMCASCRGKKNEEREYREWDTEKRKQLKGKELKGAFAGPDMSFPISSPEDVHAAWSSVGHAKNPRQVMKNILKIAKDHGWESGLPDSVKKRLEAGESGLPE